MAATDCFPEAVVLASGNQKKVAELQHLLQPLNINIVPQSQFHIHDADETGLTFVENAILKARHAAQLSGLPALADDSGLEVDALNGQLGIYSARFAGVPSNDANNNRLLLEQMKNVAPENRRARFQCVLVYLRHASDPTPLICQGAWEGSILLAPQGTQGFGYDPLFFVPTHGCSAAEMLPEEKASISHRGQAMRQLLVQLSQRYG
jgi:XTP/dITP diphosphohydrolase